MKNRIKTATAILTALLMLSSCSLIDFSEDCTYTGNVQVKFDWANLQQGEKQPGRMETVFFSQSAMRSYSLGGDTLLTGMIQGEYKILAYNQDEGLIYCGLQRIEGARVQLPVTYKDNIPYTVQAPTLYAAKTTVQISPDITALCELTPKSCVRQVFVNFIVINQGFPQVESIDGELSGVATAYSPDAMEAIPSSARLAFDSRKLIKDRFLSNLRVFGLNPAQEGQTEVQKDMNLRLQTADGKLYHENINLTKLFSGFTGASMYVTLEIRLTAMGIAVSVTDWHTVDWGIIEL